MTKIFLLAYCRRILDEVSKERGMRVLAYYDLNFVIFDERLVLLI